MKITKKLSTAAFKVIVVLQFSVSMLKPVAGIVIGFPNNIVYFVVQFNSVFFNHFMARTLMRQKKVNFLKY